jgi:hypothetical protein
MKQKNQNLKLPHYIGLCGRPKKCKSKIASNLPVYRAETATPIKNQQPCPKKVWSLTPHPAESKKSANPRSPQTASNSNKFRGPAQNRQKVQIQDRLKQHAIATNFKALPKNTQNRQTGQNLHCDKEPKTSKKIFFCLYT